jgi:polar amino acid transport system substrate-binding protein
MTTRPEITPTGRFRVGMNGSNATLVHKNADGTVSGLSADLGRFIAGRLGVPFEAVVYASSAPFTESFTRREWEIVLTGRNPFAATKVEFLVDLFLIDYVYVAARGDQFSGVADVDRPGVRIAVPLNASAQAFLSGRLEHAELVPIAGDSSAAIELLRSGEADVYASSIQNSLEIATLIPGARVIGTFETVRFAASVPKGTPAAVQARLTELVSEAKAAGVVRKALQDLPGVRVAG